MVKDGDEGNDILKGTPRDDILRGHGGKDWLFGGKGDDSLEGGDGNDTIFGGKGDDAVLAGAGHDRIWTGKGSDLVVFNEGDGKDRVFDFDQRRGGNDHSFDRVQLDVSIGANADRRFRRAAGVDRQRRYRRQHTEGQPDADVRQRGRTDPGGRSAPLGGRLAVRLSTAD